MLYAREGANRWHVLDGEGWPGCGRPAVALSLTGPARLAARVHLDDRCRLPGCADSWPVPMRLVG